MFSFDFLRSGESNCRLFFGPPWCLMTNWFPKLTFGSVISTSNLAKSVQYERVLTTSPEWNTMVCWLCTVVPVRSQRSERNKVHNYVLRVRVRVHVVVYSTWESNRIIMKLEMAAIVRSCWEWKNNSTERTREKRADAGGEQQWCPGVLFLDFIRAHSRRSRAAVLNIIWGSDGWQ